MNNEYGPVYQIEGYESLPEEDKRQMGPRLTQFFLKYGAVPGELKEGHWLGVYVDRNSEYPDLQFELSGKRLLVCDMDVHGGHLLKKLQGCLALMKGVRLVKLLEIANVKGIQEA